jgi:hypothetical protein
MLEPTDDSEMLGHLNPPPAPSAIPAVAMDAVLNIPEECKMPEGTPTVKGYDFNNGVDINKLLDSFTTMGFQGTNMGLAIEEIRRMVSYLHSLSRMLSEKNSFTARVAWK